MIIIKLNYTQIYDKNIKTNNWIVLLHYLTYWFVIIIIICFFFIIFNIFINLNTKSYSPPMK